ncbi:gastrula zinc finger protein XlCGF57.1-like [Xiphophorus maculatus]|uniref:Gastrula zinc finger protein XlCGF57.1-like n=1 Tax=Xiphophorus maculatus TaxID=8083 RepID=A0A3B5QMD5_XIPMA|nr:gastrula zinc finger protein XlCGF57.1-like [Xiphophorus maculatus]
MEARFNPTVLLHRLDVQQLMVVKEETSDDHKPCVDLYDPEPHHVKEEQEGICISLWGGQFSGKEKIDTFKFPITAIAIKTEDDEHPPLLSQFYQDQIKYRAFPEENDEWESLKIEDHGDGFNSLEPEDTERDEEDDDDVKYPVSELTHLSDSGLKTKNMGSEWKESRAPESEEDLVDRVLSVSEITEQLFRCYSFQRHMADSETGHLSSLDDSGLKEKEIVDLEVQTGEKFHCEDCGKMFSHERTLNTHMRIHREPKPYCCVLCGNGFSTKSSLNRHIRVHTGQKPYCCDLCGRKFSQKGHLAQHVVLHTGQKPFCCDVCGQRFSLKTCLTRHMRVHTGEKSYCCSICGYRSSQKGHLAQHMVVHTGERPFHCNLCGQRFTGKSSLKKHTRIHTGQKPFCCYLCGHRFTQKSNLNAHMKIHANREVA